MYFVPFGCIRDHLVAFQNSVPRSRVGIFLNERTRSNPLGPKLTFWCISYYLSAFGTVWLPSDAQYKTGRTSAKVRATNSRRIFRNERTRSTPLDPKLTFRCVSYYLDLRPFGCLPTLGAKRAELVQKFVPQSCVRIFRNERTRSTPLDPKQPFWCVSYYLGAFGIVWLPYETRCKTGRTCAKVRATKSRRNFSQRTHPIHPFGP